VRLAKAFDKEGAIHARRAHHTGFSVGNLERSIGFYRDVLGLELVGRQSGTAEYLSSVTGFSGVHLEMAFFKASSEDDHLLELLEYASHPGEPTPRETNRPGNGHLCFVVDDIRSCYRELTAKGVRFVSEPALITAGVNRGAQAAYFRDPDGFTLELFQTGPDSNA
jgi:catechol 2,3-dioxygenase-like lactoylglutathione lyase family enzyme